MISLLMTLLGLYPNLTLKWQAIYYRQDGFSIERPTEDPNQVQVLDATWPLWRDQFLMDWLKPNGEPDLNGDGIINLKDFNEISKYYMRTR